MTEKRESCAHSVAVKIIERKDISAKDSKTKTERIGDVLLVTVTEPLPQMRPEESDQFPNSSRPELAPTVVRIVSSDPTLNADQDERIIKRVRIGSTVVETIKVGLACAPP